jgi:molecular chaperone DnaJ
MDIREAYQELGVDPSVSDADLKAMWRRLVAAWHPDRNATAGASQRMQHINKAYQHIRQLRGGHSDSTEDDRHTGTHAEKTTASAEPEPDCHRRTHASKVRLSLEDAILGCTRTLSGRIVYTCDACVGNGKRVFAQACLTCNGSGAVRKATLFGWLWNEESCTDCGGDGRHRESCGACGGSGEMTVTYRRRVRFPAGVRDGHVLSVPASRDGETQIDLELEVKIKPHSLFTLDADGLLRCEMPVNGYAWMSGRWVEVPTPNGMQQMRLNRNALTYRLSHQGFPTSLRGPRGDYFVKVIPVFASHDDPEQEALLEQLIAISTQAAQADQSQPLGQWQQRLKSWNSKQKEPV